MEGGDRGGNGARTAATQFAAEHDELERLLAEHLDHTIAGDFVDAQDSFAAFALRLRAHLAGEETELFPRLAAHPSPRWPLRVYAAEHERLRLLLDRHAARLARVAAQPAAEPRSRRRQSLALLDALHSLRHVLEHHQQREALALFREVT